jgi:hypothetical protein
MNERENSLEDNQLTLDNKQNIENNISSAIEAEEASKETAVIIDTSEELKKIEEDLLPTVSKEIEPQL